MNLIPDGSSGVFAVNVFTVRPENQGAIVSCIRGAQHAGEFPGLLSMHLLCSVDGTQVINHMHWESKEAFEHATTANSAIAETAARIGALIDGAGPNRYEVVTIA